MGVMGGRGWVMGEGQKEGMIHSQHPGVMRRGVGLAGSVFLFYHSWKVVFIIPHKPPMLVAIFVVAFQA